MPSEDKIKKANGKNKVGGNGESLKTHYIHPHPEKKLEETLNQVIDSQKDVNKYEGATQKWAKLPPSSRSPWVVKYTIYAWGGATLKRANHPLASTWPPQLEHSHKKCPGQKKINTVQINAVPSSQKLH